jgi:hypothetical protein
MPSIYVKCMLDDVRSKNRRVIRPGGPVPHPYMPYSNPGHSPPHQNSKILKIKNSRQENRKNSVSFIYTSVSTSTSTSTANILSSMKQRRMGLQYQENTLT